VFYRDDDLTGFGLRVTSNCKAYIAECKVNGKNKRVTLGRHGLITAEEARQKAREVIGKLTCQRSSKQLSYAPTLAEVLEHYLSNRRLRPTTIRNHRHAQRKYFGDWLQMPVNQITEEMVLERQDMLSQTYSQTTVNIALSGLRAVLYHCMEYMRSAEGEPFIERNPVTVISRRRAWFRMRRRQGVVPDHKLAAWYAALTEVATTKVRDLLLFIILTGLRRGEATRLKWEQVDFEQRTLTIPASGVKNKREHCLPLTDFLMALLRSRKAQAGESEYVFPGRFGGHLGPWLGVINRIGDKAGCKFMIHDLRRSFVSMAAKVGVPHHLTKRLVNHIGTRDDTDEYIVISTEHLREPMERIGQRFLELMSADTLLWGLQRDVADPPTLGEVFERYLVERDLKRATVENYRRVLGVRLHDWLRLPITGITPEMVQGKFADLCGAGGKSISARSQATSAIRLLGTLFAFASTHYTAHGRAMQLINPVRLLSHEPDWRQTCPRRAVVADADLPAVYSALQSIQARTGADLFLLMLFTGLRYLSARMLQRSDV
ncbi:MAG: tyrosine-type recombinase/integrase, partial [Candidatus Dormibacteraceae bacterium]